MSMRCCLTQFCHPTNQTLMSNATLLTLRQPPPPPSAVDLGGGDCVCRPAAAGGDRDRDRLGILRFGGDRRLEGERRLDGDRRFEGERLLSKTWRNIDGMPSKETRMPDLIHSNIKRMRTQSKGFVDCLLLGLPTSVRPTARVTAQTFVSEWPLSC